MLNNLGGRKFIVAMFAMSLVSLLAVNGGDAAAFGSIALIAGGFIAGNGYVEGKHAGVKHDA